MGATTTMVLSPVPATEPTPSTTTEHSVTMFTTTGSPTPADTTPALTATLAAGSPSMALHWYEAQWTEPATWALFAYCGISLVLLYGLFVGRCLDNRLNLDFSVEGHHTRRRARQLRRELETQRSRELLHHWAHMDPYEHDLRETRVPGVQPSNDSATSVVTELGQGDEVELAEIQRVFANNGVHVSERHLREQRRAYDRIDLARSRRTTAWPSPTQEDFATAFGTIRRFHRTEQNGSGSGADISVEYAAELESHRQYRQSRRRVLELQQSMSPLQRRRLQQNAQIEANMRAVGLI